MTETRDESGAQAALKILGLFALAITAIVSDSWWVLGGLFAVPLAWWVAHRRNPLELVPMLRRTWVFLAFLLLSFLLIPPETAEPVTVQIGGWTLELSGLLVGARMCLRLLTIIVASLVLRETGRPREMLLGMRQLRLPLPVAQTIDATLTLVAAQRAGRGGRKRKERRRERREARRSEDGPKPTLRERSRAMAGRLASSFHENIERSAQQIGSSTPDRHISSAPDVVVVTALVVMVMGLKMFKLLPGIPFASGNRLMLVFPLYFAAARYTKSRVGATWMGATLGVVAFLFGEGRFGVLEIVKYLAAGVVLDLFWPLIRRRPNPVVYSFAGLLMGIAWFSSTLLAAWLASAPAIFYAIAGGMALSQLIFSVLSGPVSWALLRMLDRPAPAEAEVVDDAEGNARAGAGAGSGRGGGRGSGGGKQGAHSPK